jgi:formylglycine-generating enzyme required for sulfatase activity
MGILRWLVVTLSVVVLSTLGINAFDNMDTPSESLIGSAIVGLMGKSDVCPEGMVFVATSDGGFCIDAYEASTGDECPFPDPNGKQQSDDNLTLSSCEPVSVAGARPWRNVSRQQAELACARAGKRLPTNNEWYRAALGTPDGRQWGSEDCNLDNISASDPDATGEREKCVSPSGAYDLVGNVWEWMQETVSNGSYKNVTLPSHGYVVSINDEGVPIETHPDTPDSSLFDDYFWLDPSDTRGMFRGGYWKSQTDGGQYALNVSVPPSFVGGAVGFRCVVDPDA